LPLGNEAFQFRLLAQEPMMLALPANHPSAARLAVDLAALRTDSFLLFPRPIGPAIYDAERWRMPEGWVRSRDEPVIVEVAPQIASVITLVAAELGVAIAPASMSQLHITGVAYRAIAGEAPIMRRG
jgi:DNA-binding transcriptional LysR family regulator